MPGRRINRSSWPAAGPGRELLVSLDDAHLRGGCPSLRNIAKKAHLSHNRIRAILTGNSLPVSPEQVTTVLHALLDDASDLAESERAEMVAGVVRRYHAARRHGDAATAGPVSALIATHTKPIINLPARNPLFVGREEELAALASTFSAATDSTVVQTVRGLGGVGKTQLATEYVYRHTAGYGTAWWVLADDSVSIRGGLLRLAKLLMISPEPPADVLVHEIGRALSRRGKWILVFDSAENPDHLAPVIPSTGGHVLITTRRSGFRALGAALELDVLPRSAAVSLLHGRYPDLREADADGLADELGDLPLALEQASAYLDQTHLPPERYIDLLRTRTPDVFSRGKVARSTHTIATLWSLSLDVLRQDHPAAVQMLYLCCQLGPDIIPLDLFTKHLPHLPEPLATTVGDDLGFADTIAILTDYSLIHRTDDGVQMHRLLSSVVRGSIPESPAWSPRAGALAILRADLPSQEILRTPPTWPRWDTMLAHVLALTGRDDPVPGSADDTRWLLGRAATYLQARGRPALARPLFEQALALASELYGARHPVVATHLNDLGLAYRDLGDTRAARLCLEQAVAMHDEHADSNHADRADAYHNLALVLRATGDIDGARALLQQALEIDIDLYGETHPTVADDLNTLARVVNDQGDPAEALHLLSRALEINEKALGAQDPAIALDLQFLAMITSEIGDAPRARSLLMRALKIDEDVYGRRHPEVAKKLMALADVHLALRAFQDAMESLHRALDIIETSYGPDHVILADIHRKMRATRKAMDGRG